MDMDKKAIAFVRDYVSHNVLNNSGFKCSEANLEIAYKYVLPEYCEYTIGFNANDDLNFSVTYYFEEEEWELQVYKRIDTTILLDCDVEDLSRMMDKAK